jgi:hypothetical protein
MTRRTPADAPLRGLPERNVGLALADPVSARLDALVELVEGVGERTNRKELVAALIVGAEPEGIHLVDLVRRYRTALARDTLLAPRTAPSVLVFPTLRPGPRRRR